MNQEFDELLCGRYPAIFQDRHGAAHPTCMGRGFECGDGWFVVIDALCEEITQHLATSGHGPVIAIQVKEKFGTLRFYFRGGDEYVRGLIHMASALSARVCDRCGGLTGPTSAAGGVGRVFCCCEMEEAGSPAQPSAGAEVGTPSSKTPGSVDGRVGFRLPEIRRLEWRPLGEELERVLDYEMRNNEMAPIFIDAVIETETLAFRWRGGDPAGRAAGFFRMVEAFSWRCDRPRRRTEQGRCGAGTSCGRLQPGSWAEEVRAPAQRPHRHLSRHPSR